MGLWFLFLTAAWLASFLICFRLEGLLCFGNFLGKTVGLGDSRSIFLFRISVSGIVGVSTYVAEGGGLGLTEIFGASGAMVSGYVGMDG